VLAGNAQELIITLNSGTESTFPIPSLKKITFENDDMQVYKAGENSPSEFSIKNLCCVYFNNTVSTDLPLEKIRNPGNIEIYPNPVSEKLNIEYPISNPNNYPLHLVIYTTDGKVLLQESINNQSGSISISLSGFSNGLYIAQMQIGDVFYSKKIIKK
jgi:hypothetical protein